MQLARRGSQWSSGHVNRGNDFDAHGDCFTVSAPRTDQARINLIIAPKPQVDEPLASAIAAAYRRAALILHHVHAPPFGVGTVAPRDVELED
jgi:hypothetical protein